VDVREGRREEREGRADGERMVFRVGVGVVAAQSAGAHHCMSATGREQVHWHAPTGGSGGWMDDRRREQGTLRETGRKGSKWSTKWDEVGEA